MSSLTPSTDPGIKIPAFDNTLGALFIGYSVATILYGIGCLQMFIYLTANRARIDKLWLKLFVYLLFVTRAIECAHQLTLSAALYRFLITDYMNPLALSSGGAGSAEVFTYAQSLLLACNDVLIQLFFCWRIWVLSGVAFILAYRIAFCMLMVSLALFSFSATTDLAITGYNHRILTGNTPEFILAFKLSTTSQVAFDIIMTTAMTFTLYRAQSNIKSTKHVMIIIMLFTINSNLLSTILSISALVTFLTLPNATIYGGIGFLLGKTYFNTLLAILNSREFLREKLSQTTTCIDNQQGNFSSARDPMTETGDGSEVAAMGYELDSVDMTFNNGSPAEHQKLQARVY